MAYKVINFGATRVLPVKGVGYNLTHNQCVTVQDEEVAKILDAYPKIEVVEEVDMEEVEPELSEELEPLMEEEPIKRKSERSKKHVSKNTKCT